MGILKKNKLLLIPMLGLHILCYRKLLSYNQEIEWHKVNNIALILRSLAETRLFFLN